MVSSLVPQCGDAFRARMPLNVGAAELFEERGRFLLERGNVRRADLPFVSDLHNYQFAITPNGEGKVLWVLGLRRDAVQDVTEGGDQGAIFGFIIRHMIAKGQAFDLSLGARPQLVRAIPLAGVPA